MKKIITVILMMLAVVSCGGGGSGGGEIELKSFQLSIAVENSNASLKYFGAIIDENGIEIDESQGVVQDARIIIDHSDIPVGLYVHRLTIQYESTSGLLDLGHSDRALDVGAEIIFGDPFYSSIDWSLIEAAESDVAVENDAPTNTVIIKDSDADGVADEDDNCPFNVNVDQMNTDKNVLEQGFPVKADELGDVCDDDVDGDGRKYVFVSATQGSDENDGTFVRPVSSLGRGIELAVKRGDDVIVGGGEYDVGNVSMVTGVDIYGGFDVSEFSNPLIDPFTRRNIRSLEHDFATILKNSTSSTTIYIPSTVADVVIEGFHIYNDAPSKISAGIKLENAGSGVVVRGNTILGNEDAAITRGVIVAGGSPRLDANRVEKYGEKDGSENIGIYVDGGAPVIVNNIVKAGTARHATAIDIMGSTAIISNNTLDGTSTAAVPLTSTGLVFTNSEPVIVNNVIVAESRGASDAFAMYCYGNSDEISKLAHVQNNILSTLGGVADPVYVDCEGQFHYDTDFAVGGAVVKNNLNYTGLLADLLSDNYSLLWVAGKDAGLDANIGMFGTVIYDHDLRERVPGSFDIGAKEK